RSRSTSPPRTSAISRAASPPAARCRSGLLAHRGRTLVVFPHPLVGPVELVLLAFAEAAQLVHLALRERLGLVACVLHRRLGLVLGVTQLLAHRAVVAMVLVVGAVGV